MRDSDSETDVAALEAGSSDGVVLLAEQDGAGRSGSRSRRRPDERVGFLDVLFVRRRRAASGIAARARARDGGAAARAGGRDARARGARVERGGARDLRALGLRAGRADARRAARHARAARSPRRRRARRSARSTSRPTTSAPSSAPCTRCCRGSAAPPGRTSQARATAGSPSTTSSATVSRELLQRLAKELSYCARRRRARDRRRGRRGRPLQRSSTAAATSTSTLSVPEYFGELPPGDVVALGANPTVVARLTGADPTRVREVARTAAAPADLPPAVELVAAIAAVMGVADADHGWAVADVMLTLYDAARCPYCARVRIVLAEKGDRVRAGRDRPRRPAGLDLREELHRPRARDRGGRRGCCRSRP